MRPTINSGDFLIYKPIKSKTSILKTGNLVVIKHPAKGDTLLVKRIFKINHPLVEVRGDNKINSIDSRQFGIINEAHIIGIVDLIIPSNS